MKLLECKYAGFDSPFTKVKVSLEINGKIVEGDMLWENDGRDMEVESGLEPYYDIILEQIDDIYQSPEQLKLLEGELEKGYKEYEASLVS